MVALQIRVDSTRGGVVIQYLGDTFIGTGSVQVEGQVEGQLQVQVQVQVHVQHLSPYRTLESGLEERALSSREESKL